MIGLTIFSLVMLAVTRQLVESVSLTLKTSRLLEYARTARSVIESLDQDVRTAQTCTLYTSFTSRTAQAAGNYGDYLVLQQIADDGTVTRTVGYYTVPNGTSGSFSLYRHDSADGTLAAGQLPDASTSGTHRRFVGTLRLPTTPTGVRLFRNWNDRGVSIRGEFGAVSGQSPNALNLIQCTLATRS